jgi:hypothetical protein
MFNELAAKMMLYEMAGIVAREGANRITKPYIVTTRQMRVHAYNPQMFRRLGIRWDLLRSPGPEDFCALLQLLTNGYTNVVLNNWCQNQGGSDVSGVCSTYRTPEVHADACRHLAELFPAFVTVVQKVTKTSWGGGERTDVRIQWKKAHQWGRNNG